MRLVHERNMGHQRSPKTQGLTSSLPMPLDEVEAKDFRVIDVRYWHKTDMPAHPPNVYYRG